MKNPGHFWVEINRPEGLGQFLTDLKLGPVFASRTEAMAPSSGKTGSAWTISVVHASGTLLSYIYDPDGTVLVTGDGRRWSPATTSVPEMFGATGGGLVDDTAALIAWMEYGGKMYADGHYLVAAAGPDAGGAYARLLRSVDVSCGPNCRFIAGEGLDNDVLRWTAQWSLYDPDNLLSIKWRGGLIDQSGQSGQCNSTVIPNAATWPGARPGTSVTTDGLYLIGYVKDPATDIYYIAVSLVDIDGLKTYAGKHWQSAGGDSALFVSGAQDIHIRNSEFTGNRDCAIYHSELPNGEILGNSVHIHHNTFRSCHWGAAAKRLPSGLSIHDNIGINTPQVIVVSGLTGDTGSGGSVHSNQGFNAFEVVRLDDVSEMSAFNNKSYNHGALLEDGTVSATVFGPAYNTVVRGQGIVNCDVYNNSLRSISPEMVTAGHPVWVVRLNAGPLEGAPSTHNQVHHNSASVGYGVVQEASGQADHNRMYANRGPASMAALVSLSGANSLDDDAPIAVDTSTSTITGTTSTVDLKSFAVRPNRFARAGDMIAVKVSGQFAGPAGTKRITVVAGGTTVAFPEGPVGQLEDWTVSIDIIFTGSSGRLTATYVDNIGNSYTQVATASLDATAAWPITIKGRLSNAADSITCNTLWAKLQ